MFEKFQEFLYKAMSYEVDEIEVGVRYVAKHVDCETREKWCKSKYFVTRSEDFFSCECFMYEHMGMLCAHVLKVSHRRGFILMVGCCLDASTRMNFLYIYDNMNFPVLFPGLSSFAN
jgi:hypothetical protein